MSDFTTLRMLTPFQLERKKVKEEPKTTKLAITTVDGTVHKRTHPILDFERGSEHIMFCLDEFDNIANQFTFNNNDNWQYFRDILGHNERTTVYHLQPIGPQRSSLS